MPDRARELLILTALLLFATVVFTVGITWGLPSRESDVFLFGDRTPWTGAEILRLAPPRSSAAADVDANPAVRGSVVNDTDAKRAEIVRRYRLFTYQPDEMITMMSLAQMHPSAGDLDPRLYQYGGLWIYPVGALIKLLLHPVADPAYYLDHPERFAHFYVVARAYSAAWGVVGAWAVYRLLRGTTRFAAIFATLLYITMPVVVNMAHEAKPHLPGAALTLLTAMAARRFVEQGRRRDLLLMSLLAGAAAGMILSATVAIIIAMIAILLRGRMPGSLSFVLGGEGRDEGLNSARGCAFKIEISPHPNPLHRVMGRGDGHGLAAFASCCALALIVASATYAVTNPYVVKHLLSDRAAVSANLGNSSAMYHVDPLRGTIRAIQLIAEGAGLITVAEGIIGVGVLVTAARRLATDRTNEITGHLPALAPLIICSLTVAFQFASLAAGKPGEYGRFALIIDITLALIAAVALGEAASSRKLKNLSIVFLLLGTTLPALIYEYGFWSDSYGDNRRARLADQLAQLPARGITTLMLPDEPAPYLMPPIDLWKWQIILFPHEAALSALPSKAAMLTPAGAGPMATTGYESHTPPEFADIWPAGISWANKRLELWLRRP